MSECPHGLFDVCCTNYERCTLGAPKKEWVGLTDEEYQEILTSHNNGGLLLFYNLVEEKLREKNSG